MAVWQGARRGTRFAVSLPDAEHKHRGRGADLDIATSLLEVGPGVRRRGRRHADEEGDVCGKGGGRRAPAASESACKPRGRVRTGW
jgi:hypothetical protein